MLESDLPLLERLELFATIGDHAANGELAFQMLNGDLFREAHEHIQRLQQAITLAADMLEMSFPRTASAILVDMMFDEKFGWRTNDRDD